MNQTLLIRTDGSNEIGTGHVMRCLTLAQSWSKTGSSVIFVGAEIPAGLRDRIDEWSEAIHDLDTALGSQEDATSTVSIVDEYDADWIIVDGPHFGTNYLTNLTTSPAKVLLIDDMGERHHYSTDIVLNQNLHADPEMYENRELQTELLLGPDYVLLRDEFLEWLDWSPDAGSTPKTILVTLGGSDPGDSTAKVINAIDRIEVELEILVIVGAANDSLSELVELANSNSQPIQFKQNVSNMAEQMARADLAVSSGGTTCWELAFMGVPTVVGTIASVEEYLVAGLQEVGLFSHLGDFNTASESEIAAAITRLIDDTNYRIQMSDYGQELIDGHGRKRTIKAMRNF